MMLQMALFHFFFFWYWVVVQLLFKRWLLLSWCCVLNYNDFYMPPTIRQCMWGCLIVRWLAKSQALKKDVTLLGILSLKCSMSTGLVPGPYCALGLIYWTCTQLCHCGFISAHSKLLSWPAVIPSPHLIVMTSLN